MYRPSRWCGDDVGIMGTMWRPTWSGDHGDNMETKAMGVWGTMWQWQGWHGDYRDNMGTTGMTWEPQGCQDHKITKNAITLEWIKIIQFRLKFWDPHTYVIGLLTEFHITVKLRHQMAQIVSTTKISVSFYGRAPLLLLPAVCWFSSYSVKTWLQCNQCAGDGSEMKQMQSLCYKGTHKETKWLAVKSKGVVQVFRMFHLDGCLPKDCTPRWGWSLLLSDLRWETTQGGCDVTNSDIWWYLQDFGGKLATTQL